MPHHKSCKKRLKTSALSNQRNRATRSAIRTSLKLIRTAESKDVVLAEMPRLFSILDKAARLHRAGFNKNRASNYKAKVAAILNGMA